jgi:hypothetical protein
MSSFSVLFCPVYVEAFATCRSLVQTSRTECLNTLRNLPCEVAKGPYKDCKEADNNNILHNLQ